MKRKWTTGVFSAIILLALMAVPVLAVDDVNVTWAVDRNEMTVGDPVQLTLEVTHPAGFQVVIPKLEQSWGPFEVRGQSQVATETNDDGTETTRQTVEVTLFDLGEFETPPLPLMIGDGSGQVLEEVAPSVKLMVTPTLAEDDTALRDIKPQAGLAVPPVWPWIAGALFAAAAAVIGGWWLYRRWRGEPAFRLPRAVDNRPPWQVAYDELVRIEGLGLVEQGRFKEYYTLVTDCLRTYLEAQFDLSAFDRTTSELRPVLRRSELDADHAREFLDLFMASDLVKFAKLTPDVREAMQLTGEARQLVEATRPAPEPATPPSGEKPTVAPMSAPKLGYESGQ
jgi:hypothetical protein